MQKTIPSKQYDMMAKSLIERIKWPLTITKGGTNNENTVISRGNTIRSMKSTYKFSTKVKFMSTLQKNYHYTLKQNRLRQKSGNHVTLNSFFLNITTLTAAHQLSLQYKSKYTTEIKGNTWN